MYPIMDGGNVNTSHDCMYVQSYILNLQVCLSIYLSVRAVSRHYPDLCFFVFFLWVLFFVSVKMPGTLFFFFFFFFFLMGFVFCVS
jgi:hypothetical protein